MAQGRLSRYFMGVDDAQAAEFRDVQQAGALQQLQSRIQAQKEQEQLKQILASDMPDTEKQKILSRSPAGLGMLKTLADIHRKETVIAPAGSVPITGGVRGEQVPFRPEPAKPFGQVHNVPGGYIAMDPSQPGKYTFTRTQREPPAPQEPAPAFMIVQHPQSPTGWSHRNTRTGELILGAPPPAAAAKASDKEEALGKGKEQVSQIIGNLNAQYQELNRQGAITDVSKGTVFNLGRAAAASTPGQIVGRAVGTQAQGIRNQINMSRPLLMNAIRQATGQSAKSLDSNVELQFYLQAATDTQTDIDSNMAALDHLDKIYGLGIGINSKPSALKALRDKAPKVTEPVPSGVDPKIWAVMTPEERALWPR